MITLNLDQGLVNVQTWDDIVSLVDYTPELNPSEHSLSKIIGRYVFEQMIKCGLSNCHTHHSRGYIVATKLGPITNIGKDCGKKYFGVDFEAMSRQFERDIDEKEMRERLATFAFRIEETEEQVRTLRGGSRGANWAYGKIHELVTPGGNVPLEVIRSLGAMIRAGSGSITKPREATIDEIATLRASGKRVDLPYYLEEVIGDIKGIQALYTEYDLRQLLIIDIEDRLKIFKTLNIDLLGFNELKVWSKWLGTIEHSFEKTNEALEFGRELLAKDNLVQFDSLLDTKASKSFNKFLNDL